MRLKANVFSLLPFFILLFITKSLFSSQRSIYSHRSQPLIISSILEKEKSVKNTKNIIDILNLIDDTYGNLYSNLLKGDKLTIFFDPAHGKLENGKWEGEVSGRVSCTGIPEEYYSIQISRRLYKLLSDNRFLKIKSTDDYLSVMNGKKIIYNNIPFSKTIRMSNNNNALIIISEHLNNISSLLKADGLVNISGIHITHDEIGNRYLTYVESSHKGFLTLYNKYDITGFSKALANKLKRELVSKGMEPNNWGFGSVPDDRFSYFTNFPISVMFESGFISNPIGEKKLRDPDYQKMIAESQYKILLECIRDILGVDISDYKPIKTRSMDEILTLLKLSRIAIYYIQNCNSRDAIATINTIEEFCKNENTIFNIKPYLELKKRIIKSERYYKEGKRLIRSRKFRKAKRYLLIAKRTASNEPIYESFYNKYSKSLWRYFRIKEKDTPQKERETSIPLLKKVKRAPLWTPIILAVEDDHSLNAAIDKALSPDPKRLERLIKSFRNAFTWKRVKVRKYSKKKRKSIYCWKWKKKKIDFKKGIYIVKLNRNLVVNRVRRVGQVPLDHNKYQNEQYLKNSFFANREKSKSR